MHMSLWKDGKPVFFDEARQAHRMSETMRHFVGGQQRVDARAAGDGGLHRELLPPPDPGLLGADGVDLGRREPHDLAARLPARPSRRAWSTSIAAADSNPSLALAAAVGSGLWGIENKVDPGEPIGQLLRDRAPREAQASAHPVEAAHRLKASKAARDLFGDAFVDHYSATREWEEREFRKAITEWELARYMEII